MTSLYGEFSRPDAIIHFPGAAFMMGSIFALVSLVIAWTYLRRELPVDKAKPVLD
jgi:hypothetical protein